MSRTLRPLLAIRTPAPSLRTSPPRQLFRSTIRHPRAYSTAPPAATPQSKFQEALYFRPRTWLLSGLFFTLLGATTVLMSVRDFIAYTDAETLTLFQPSTAKEEEVETFLQQHPLVKSLRADPKYTESRPTLKVNEAYRANSLTSGVLAAPGRLTVPPIVFAEDGGKSLVQIFYLGEEVCGYPGVVHGGLLATILDEGLARCSFGALPNGLGMTANLKIDYRKPSPANGYYVLRAETTKVDGRKAWVKGHIESLGGGEDGMEGSEVKVEAEALMIEPKQASVSCPGAAEGGVG